MRSGYKPTINEDVTAKLVTAGWLAHQWRATARVWRLALDDDEEAAEVIAAAERLYPGNRIGVFYFELFAETG